MLENDLHEMFEWQASADQPPAQVSFPVVRRRAQLRRRWRRAATIGAPIVAAAAAVAIGITASLVSGVTGIRPAPTGPTSQAATGRFNPLVPYAAFGWLPGSQHEAGGRSSKAALYLFTASDLKTDYASLDLAAYYPGQCSQTAAKLTCGSGTTGGGMVLTGRAPDVGGQAAYLGHEIPAALTEPLLPADYPRRGKPLLLPMIAFRDPRGGWALLVYPARGISRSAVLRVADNVQFGQTTPLTFPVSLVGVPRQWHTVDSVNFTRDGRSLQASMLWLGPPMGSAWVPRQLTLGFGQGGGPYDCQTGLTCEVIDGYRVTLGHFSGLAASGPPVPVYTLTANDADGILVSIDVTGPRPPLSPSEIFAHHIRLLGPNPANWTTTLFSP